MRKLFLMGILAMMLLMGSIIPARGSDFLISTFGDSNQGKPALAYNSVDNQYLVVWSDDRNAAEGLGTIYGQLVDGDGSLIDDAHTSKIYRRLIQ